MHEEVNSLRVALAEANSKLAKAESALSSGSESSKLSKLSRKLEKAEADLSRLRLRVESRGAPYYHVIKEHFPADALKKFVDPNH